MTEECEHKIHFAQENCPADVFENAIRKFGVTAACEWFGYSSDSDFTQETIKHLQKDSG